MHLYTPFSAPDAEGKAPLVPASNKVESGVQLLPVGMNLELPVRIGELSESSRVESGSNGCLIMSRVE